MSNKSILLTHPGGIGDAVMLIPLITALNKNGYQVDILCKNKVVFEVMKNVPSLRTPYLFPWLKTTDLFLNKNARHMIKELKKNQYHSALQPFQGRGIFSVLLMLKSGIKNRFHHTYRFKFLKETGLFLTKHKKIEEKHSLYNNIDLAKIAKLLPQNYIIDETLTFKKEKYIHSFSKLAQKYASQNNKLIGIYPGGGDNKEFEFKRWKYSNWISLIDILLEQYKDYKFLIFLGPGEKTIVDFFKKYESDRVIIVNESSIGNVLSLLSGLDFFIGNDGGLSHLASIFEIYELIIFGATDWRYVYPLNKNSNIILPPNDSPIFVPYVNMIKDISENKLNDITVDMVVKKILSLLKI